MMSDISASFEVDDYGYDCEVLGHIEGEEERTDNYPGYGGDMIIDEVLVRVGCKEFNPVDLDDLPTGLTETDLVDRLWDATV